MVEKYEVVKRTTYHLLSTSWVLPGMPLVFGCIYLVLSIIEEPFRPDLAIAGVLSLMFGIILILLVITSRVIIDEDTLDSRHCGLRKVIHLHDLKMVYSRPSAFSSELIFEDRSRKSLILHLGYWHREKQLLKALGDHVEGFGAECSVGSAKLLRIQPNGKITDEKKPRLTEPLLILAWILSSTAVPVLIGLLLT